MRVLTIVIFLILFCGFCSKIDAQNTIVLKPGTELYRVDHDLVYLEDKESKLELKDVVSDAFKAQFQKSKKDVLAFGITNSTIWLKIKVKNTDPAFSPIMLFDEPEVSHITIYEPAVNDKIMHKTGFLFPVSTRPLKSSTYSFPLTLKDTLTHTFFVKIHSNRTLILPVFFVSDKELLKREGYRNVGYGIYFGIFAGLFLYNLFLLFGLKDKAYLYYLFSIFASFLMFASVTGYTAIYLFPNAPLFNRLLIEIGAVLLAIFSALFAGEFLYIKLYSKLLQRLLYACCAVALFSFVLILIGRLYTVQEIMYNLLSVQIFIMLACGIVSYRNGNKYAAYYIVAWIGYMTGGLLILTRDQGLLPYNFITTHSAEAGSALEIILLSLALSSRYQTYRKEKEEATKLALKVQQEANETLENKVTERTAELELTLRELKSTQVQLIQTEKMASLGVMTAGVAHEINNPVNYVTAGLASLKQNYEDMSQVLKETILLEPEGENKERVNTITRLNKKLEIPELLPEMDSLFQSVNNGALRISEIVKGLRNFTRLDESELKRVNLEDGIDATITMLSEKLGNNVQVIKEYGNIKPVLCLASQINQVFMNLLYNAIDAVEGKGEIRIKTQSLPGDKVRISIQDNGKGIPENIKSRIFDPFFTTKDVGKGTGLGLSVSYNIIKKHHGSISFQSSPETGTAFFIELDLDCKIEE